MGKNAIFQYFTFHEQLNSLARILNILLINVKMNTSRVGILTTKINVLTLFSRFLSSADFSFKINFFEKFFQKYDEGVKQFGSRSDPTSCRA